MSKSYKDFITKSETLTNKDEALKSFVISSLNKLQSMFTYEGLPDTIPQKWLEYYLMCNGNVFITKVNGELYAFTGSVGGEPDVYYQPTIYTVANPALNYSKNLKIDEDGVLIRNDSFMYGMLPIIYKYGSLLVESDLTIRCALINMRLVNLLSAPDDNTKKSADEYISKIINGEISVIGESPFFDGIKLNTNSNLSGYLNQLIEMTQYIKASFYNEIGLNANYNLKREYISTTENSLADDILLPLCDNMLKERQEGVAKVNEMFGTNITVEFNSSWKTNATQNDKEVSDNESAINSDEQSETNEPVESNEPNETDGSNDEDTKEETPDGDEQSDERQSETATD